MNKNLLLSLLLAGSASTIQADEARLLRFPATNGQEIVFSYAGDLYKAPLAGGEAQRLTSHIGYLITRQAMERKESRGLHYTIDYPHAKN